MKRKTLNKALPLVLIGSMLMNICSPAIAYAAENETIINGKIKAATIDISASATANYIIEEKTLTSDTLQVLNNAGFPVSIGVADVEKTIGTIEDVLPSAVGTQEQWFNLGRRDSESKIALGLKHTGGDYLEEYTSDTLYFKAVQDSTETIGLGAIGANATAEYQISGFHGLAFSSEISEQYKVTWDIGLYEGSGSTGGETGGEVETPTTTPTPEEDNNTGDIATFSVDREIDTPLTYEVELNQIASAANLLNDLFGVHEVKAAPIDVPQDEVTPRVVGEATITGLKNTSISELYIADYYQDENGDYYKITGIKEGTAADPTIKSDSLNKVVISGFVNEIPDYAFYSNQNLTDVIVEEGIVRIGKYAFYQNMNLKTLSLPDSLEIIDYQAFAQCYNLLSVNSEESGICDLPDGLKTIASQAFYSNYYIKEVYVPASVETIDYRVFGSGGNSSDLKKDVILEATTIDDFPEITLVINGSSTGSNYSNYFNKTGSYFCTQNEDLAYQLINMYNGLPVRVSGQDYLCTFSSDGTSISLESVKIVNNATTSACVTIPATINGLPVTTINGTSSEYSSYIKMISIPDTITTVTNADVFKNISYVEYNGSLDTTLFSTSTNTTFITDESVLIDNFLYEDQSYNTLLAYLGNDSEVIIPNGVKTIGNKAFYKCSDLVNVTIPEGVTSIGEKAFSGCQKLSNVTLPSTINNFGDYAFENCKGLTEFTIPSGVTAISNYMFSGCSNLMTLNIPVSLNTIGNNAFSYCNSSTVIINYEGIQEQWNNISGITNFDFIKRATINYETY